MFIAVLFVMTERPKSDNGHPLLQQFDRVNLCSLNITMKSVGLILCVI